MTQDQGDAAARPGLPLADASGAPQERVSSKAGIPIADAEVVAEVIAAMNPHAESKENVLRRMQECASQLRDETRRCATLGFAVFTNEDGSIVAELDPYIIKLLLAEARARGIEADRPKPAPAGFGAEHESPVAEGDAP